MVTEKLTSAQVLKTTARKFFLRCFVWFSDNKDINEPCFVVHFFKHFVMNLYMNK